MKKTITLSLNFRFILGIAFMFLFLNSCRKDLYVASNQEAIIAAQQLLKKQTGGQDLTTALFRKGGLDKLSSAKTSSSPGIPANADLTLNADWSNAKTYAYNDQTIIEVPLLHDGVFMFNLGPLNKDAKINNDKSITRLLFFKTKEKTQGYFITIISSDEYLKLAGANPQNNTHLKQESDFSGAIIYHDLNGNYNAGRRFDKQENLLNKLSSTKNEGPGKISQAIPSGCYEQDLWEVFGQGCSEVPGGLHCNYIYSELTGTYLVCPDGNNPNPGGGGGGGTGNPPIPDCAGVVGGTAYTNTDCNTCMGGTTGITSCAIGEIKTDSLNAKFPCAKKLIIDKLNEISGFTSLALPFQGQGEVPNLNWDSKELVWAGGDNHETYKLGETDNYLGWSSTIYLNSKAIQNASKLFVAATAIHEVVHAYSNYLVKKNIYYPNSNNASWANDVQYWAIVDSLNQVGQANYVQHTNFLEQYFETTVNILSAFDNNAHTMDEYRMTMLYGLSNAGDAPSSVDELSSYNARKGKLEATYNKLLTKYGLTSSEINSFYKNNVKNVASNKKLPTSCP